MNPLVKIIRADETRPTRLHTQAGQLVSFKPLVSLPASGLTYVALKALKFRLRYPWWVWEAAKFVQRNLKEDDVVVEDGSGMSTIWLARRCAQIFYGKGL